MPEGNEEVLLEEGGLEVGFSTTERGFEERPEDFIINGYPSAAYIDEMY